MFNYGWTSEKRMHRKQEPEELDRVKIKTVAVFIFLKNFLKKFILQSFVFEVIATHMEE